VLQPPAMKRLSTTSMPSPHCKHIRPRSQCKECGGRASVSTNGAAAGARTVEGAASAFMGECAASASRAEGKASAFRRSQCKPCGGKGICIHGRRRCTCKPCGGGSICIHELAQSMPPPYRLELTSCMSSETMLPSEGVLSRSSKRIGTCRAGRDQRQVGERESSRGG